MSGGSELRIAVCQVLAGVGDGGLEKHFVELTNRLTQCCDVSAIAHASFAARLSPAVRLFPLDLSGSRLNPLTIRRLRRALRNSGCQVVHAHANKAAALVARAARGLDLATVATIHNVKRSMGMFRRFDRVIAVSPLAAEGLDHPHIEIIFNGITPPPPPEASASALQRASLGLTGQSPVAVSVGRLVEAKGFDLLIDAWREIDAQLLIVGDGPQRAQLAGQIQRLALGDRVHLLGHRHDVPALLNLADLVVIASRREGYSYVMCEALHARRVIVSTDVGGPAVLLPQAFLVPVENVPALNRCITATLADLSAAHRHYEPVWQMAAEELTIDAMADKTESLYRRLLNGE
jgi:glycosyltransferase involved in cell wall biosynthesis